MTGETFSSDFPLAAPVQGVFGGINDAFITKIGTTSLPVVTLSIAPDVVSVAQSATLGYNVTATNTTAVTQCFQYWENLTLAGGITYPATGELLGPIRLCLNAGATQTTHLTHGVPMNAPLSAYALNAYVGAYGVPARHIIVNEAHFTFTVTAPAPVPVSPQTSWQLLENGFK